ncbi:MAG: efflux RND transporter permease subunit, partial [Proteobacteria bacterium]|nr:efflux RND transporter permease subunit [Pseudomonadota bacterium]
MERLIRYFVERPMLVMVLVATILVLGYWNTVQLPRETFPNISLPTLMVRAQLQGASARDIETKLTIPIEEAIEELDGVKNFHTVVSDNTSVTTIELYDEFEEGDIDEAELDLRTLLDGIHDFPPDMHDDPTITRMKPREFPVVQVALSGPSDAVVRAAKDLEKRLRRLDVVSRVTLVGLQDPEVRILVDPSRARASGVTLLDVVRAVERRNVSSTGGVLESESRRRQVVLWSRFERPEQVGETVLRFLPGGGAVRLRDVARIETGREDTGLIAHTGGQPGISLVVRKQGDSDILRAVDAVSELVEATELPAGVGAVLVDDRSHMTRTRLSFIATNGSAGAALVALVLFVFLTPTTAVWVLLGIPVAFLGALAVFPVFDMGINMVTLTGFVVALGMVVDAGVVVGERIVARRARRVAAVEGAVEMWRPVLASVVTTVLAFLPMFGLGGMAGRMIGSMPYSVGLVLLFSMLLAFLILPGQLSLGSGLKQTPKRAFIVRLEERYRRALQFALHHRPAVIGVFALIFLTIVIGITPLVPVVVMPQDESEALFIKVNMPLGTPIEQTEAAAAALERQIPAIIGPDLGAVTARIGHQDTDVNSQREQGAAENEAIVSALLDPGLRERTSAEWIEVLRERLVVPPEADLVYEPAVFGPPQGLPVTVHVASNGDERRRETALEVADWLRAIPGVVNIEIDERPGTPQIDLNVDYARLSLRGLDAQDVARTLKAAFSGIKASEHRDLDDTTEFRVMLDPSARVSLDSLLEIPVRASSGELVRLRDVVDPIAIPAVSRIYHRDGWRAATVTAGFIPGSEHTSLTMAERLEAELLPRYAGDPEIDMYLGGEAVESRKVVGDVGSAALLAVVGIAVVIALMLGSFLEAFFVVSIVPFAIAGVILAHFVHGRPLALFAMLGAIGLAGVVVNSSIVMVDSIHRRLANAPDEGPEARRERIIDAVVLRLRPILVTTLTTLLGVLPAAYGIGGFDSSVAGMSLALGWGLA